MKKIQYNYLPADSSAIGNTEKKSSKNLRNAKDAATPPNEETVERLNAMAREYPFCAYMKARGNSLL